MNNVFHIVSRNRDPEVKRLYVGAPIPQHAAERLSLVALYKRIPKVQVIEEAIDKAADQEVSNEIIIKTLVYRAVKEWEHHRQIVDPDPAQLEKYFWQLRQTLISKGVSRSLTKEIMSRIEHAAYKRETECATKETFEEENTRQS